MNSDSIILIFIFITHLFLYCWAILDFMDKSYIAYNTFFLLSLLWSVHETKSSAPTLMAFLINVMSIIMDAILIGILWHDPGNRRYQFIISVMASFLNLIYRLITSLIIFQIWRKRMETETNMENMGSVTRELTKYLNFGRSEPAPRPTNGVTEIDP